MIVREAAEIACRRDQRAAAGAPVPQLHRIDAGAKRGGDHPAPLRHVRGLHDQHQARRADGRRSRGHSIKPESGLEAVA